MPLLVSSALKRLKTRFSDFGRLAVSWRWFPGGVRRCPGSGRSFHFFAVRFHCLPDVSFHFIPFQYVSVLSTSLHILANPCTPLHGQGLVVSGSIRIRAGQSLAVSGGLASPGSGRKAHLPFVVWVHLGRFAGISQLSGVVVPPEGQNAPYGQKKGRKPNEK